MTEDKTKTTVKDFTKEDLILLKKNQSERLQEEYSYAWEEWGGKNLYFKRLTNPKIDEAHKFAMKYYRKGKKVVSALLACLIIVAEARGILELETEIVDFMIEEVPGELKQTADFVLSVSKQPDVDTLIRSMMGTGKGL